MDLQLGLKLWQQGSLGKNLFPIQDEQARSLWCRVEATLERLA